MTTKAKSRFSVVPGSLKSPSANSRAEALIAIGRKIVTEEEEAVSLVAASLNVNFAHVVDHLLQAPASGRVLFSGIGKAGFIGMKLSSSFASVGIPSFFVHPAEAMHGDLGRVTSADTIFLLSNSGDTPEMVRLLAGLLKMKCFSIAVTSKADSYLAQHSSTTLLLPSVGEAGPLGLAPTSSTTAMLVLGDALLMTVLSEKDFAREDFAKHHPGGTLGRTLMNISEVMRTGEALCIVEQQMLCKDVLHRITLTKGRPGAAAVVDTSGVLVGIFTDGDLRRCLDQDSGFLSAPVKNVMGKKPKTVTADLLADEALKVMSTHEIDQVLVVDIKNRPVGLVDIQDLIRPVGQR